MAMICRTSDGDLLDTLCYQHYGHLKGTVEAVRRIGCWLMSRNRCVRGC
jgi:phage tail protein X